MSDLSNSLADLAERVRDATEMSAAAGRTSVEKALEAGRFLCEAKEQCRHGEWLPFLKRATVHERQARRLMQLARSGLETGHVSDLGGIGAALQWLGAFSMPTDRETLVVSLDDFADGADEPLAFIWRDGGGFHVAMIDLNAASPHAICTVLPVQDERAARMTLYRVIDYRMAEASFAMVSDHHISRAFLSELRNDILRGEMGAREL